MNIKIEILGSNGRLSKYLKLNLRSQIFIKNQAKKKTKFSKKIIIATYSPTAREDCEENLNNEISYYKKLIKNFKKNEHLIYISSQTVELTNFTNYSQAKKAVETLLSNNKINYTVIRPGMIYDSKNNEFFLDNMQKASLSFLSFYKDLPKTTICFTKDLLNLIYFISQNNEVLKRKVINIGIKRYRFYELQNLSKKLNFRLKILPFDLLILISSLNPQLKAYTHGKACLNSPDLAWDSFKL